MDIRVARRRALPVVLLALAVLAVVLTAALGGARDGSGADGATGQAAPAGPEQVDLAARVHAYTAGFGPSTPYTTPDEEQRRAVADGVAQAVEGGPAQAGPRLRAAGYRLTEWVDSASGRRFAEIADASGGSEAERGWGRVYLDLSAKASWSVQVPHPVFDTDTELLGVAAFRAAPGGVMVLAGAHRKAGAGGSSDPAHRTDTVFDAVIGALAARGLPGIQVHGFDEGSLPGRDAVVSGGSSSPGPAAQLTADGLEGAGFAVCRAWRDRCGHLEGTTNVQGRFAAGLGVPWLHVELGNGLRTDPARRAEVAAALGVTARSWSAARRSP
ncbi:hypothetical protein GCM10010495_24930 [Kitasatospora herbaricolor]|uniref:hypothetical protein n=1 Tax=Kitasatospora herbaricolor TaxID=68217 RepID=UPI0017486F1B|nr:hypothetical protein [Kitasatospora herbaricolor]MDQ0308726.1 hypothetical protein [Kitasatospora herbaricolor]GGV10519.1 hypothetical protein GCM10010495_24930 [Kitasatospora herbaricolor]